MQILTPTGYQDITDLSVGSDVLAYEVGTGIEITNQIEQIDEVTADNIPLDENGQPMYPFQWYLINGEYKIFAQQSIWNSPTTVVHGFELQVGDTIYDDEDEDLLVTSIEECEGDETWYRLHISGDHSFIADGITLHNASRYWVGGTATWDATASTKWSTTSGGGGGSAVPTASDDVFLDGNSGANTVTVSGTRVGLSLVCTGFTGTLDGSGSLTISGTVTFVAGMTLNVTGTLTLNATATLTSGGQTWAGNFTITGAITLTLASNWTITGLVTRVSSNATLNGAFSLTCNGGLTMTNNLTGTATVVINGGTWSGTGTLSCNTSINDGVTVSGTVAYGINTLTYIGSTNSVTTTSSTLNLSSCTLATNGMTWNNITALTGNVTLTLSSNLTCSGNFTSSNSGANNLTINNNTLTVGGDLNFNSLTNSGQVTGSTEIVLNGTGTMSSTNAITSRASINITINTSGTITIGNFSYGGGTLTYTTGTIAGTGTITFRVATSTWTNNATFTGVAAGVAVNVTVAADLTINGTNGFLLSTFTCATAGTTVTWKNGITYNINSTLTLTGTAASNVVFVSDSGGSQATVILAYGATQSVSFVNATDIYSRGGQTIWDYKGTLNNASNWRILGPTLQTQGFAYVQ